jgi:hypothetical protein
LNRVGLADRKADLDGRYTEGEDGWLFLDGDTNEVMAQHGGRLLLSEAELIRWERRLARRFEVALRHGGPYLHLVPPNNHAVNEEFLPPHIGRGRPRPVTQLLEFLARPRLSVAKRASLAVRRRPRPAPPLLDPEVVMYPVERLRAARTQGWPYTKTDTHWTRFGAWTAYGAVAEVLTARCDMRVLTDADVVFAEDRVRGDLGAKLNPPRESLVTTVQPRSRQHEILADNLVRNNGRLIDVRCRAAPDTAALVVGDSFSYQLLPFLSESFGRVRFAHFSSLDPVLIEDWSPDVVITILNERFMIRLPADKRGSFNAEFEAKVRGGFVKRQERAVRYARGKFGGWPGAVGEPPASPRSTSGR